MRQLGVIIFMAFNLLYLLAYSAEPAVPQVIKVSAKKFEFTPSVIKVKKGVPITLEIVALDRKHGFKLKEFNIAVEITPDKPATVTFTPDKVGTFMFHCSVFCGSGHEDMMGTIEVTE